MHNAYVPGYENCPYFFVGVPSFSIPSNILGTYISADDNFEAGTGAIAPQANFYLQGVADKSDT